jgi:hypothetical protein
MERISESSQKSSSPERKRPFDPAKDHAQKKDEKLKDSTSSITKSSAESSLSATSQGEGSKLYKSFEKQEDLLNDEKDIQNLEKEIDNCRNQVKLLKTQISENIKRVSENDPKLEAIIGALQETFSQETVVGGLEDLKQILIDHVPDKSYDGLPLEIQRRCKKDFKELKEKLEASYDLLPQVTKEMLQKDYQNTFQRLQKQGQEIQGQYRKGALLLPTNALISTLVKHVDAVVALNTLKHLEKQRLAVLTGKGESANLTEEELVKKQEEKLARATQEKERLSRLAASHGKKLESESSTLSNWWATCKKLLGGESANLAEEQKKDLTTLTEEQKKDLTTLTEEQKKDLLISIDKKLAQFQNDKKQKIAILEKEIQKSKEILKNSTQKIEKEAEKSKGKARDYEYMKNLTDKIESLEASIEALHVNKRNRENVKKSSTLKFSFNNENLEKIIEIVKNNDKKQGTIKSNERLIFLNETRIEQIRSKSKDTASKEDSIKNERV